ncbi:MAG: hypothetical protein SFV19_17290 [Rhodospirillaceae bacterium]|nr:hypothetical protein [Rhodospirillaceae bacterium]
MNRPVAMTSVMRVSPGGGVWLGHTVAADKGGVSKIKKQCRAKEKTAGAWPAVVKSRHVE